MLLCARGPRRLERPHAGRGRGALIEYEALLGKLAYHILQSNRYEINAVPMTKQQLDHVNERVGPSLNISLSLTAT